MAQRKHVPHSAFAATSLPPALVVHPPLRASSAFPCAVGPPRWRRRVSLSVHLRQVFGGFTLFFLVRQKDSKEAGSTYTVRGMEVDDAFTFDGVVLNVSATHPLSSLGRERAIAPAGACLLGLA